MLPKPFAVLLLAALTAVAAEMPLPGLRIEPTGGGSIFYVKNNATVALTGYLIELVDYPGSSYSFWQDETIAEPIAPQGEKRIQVTNMTVGAVPDYVKMQAAVYAGGATAGIPEKVTQLLDRRRAVLDTTRQLIARIEKAGKEGTPKSALIGDLKQWADTMQPQGRANRNSPAAINQAAAGMAIGTTVARLDAQSQEETLALLRGWERALAANTPAK
jgi:hypothetical protein